MSSTTSSPGPHATNQALNDPSGRDRALRWMAVLALALAVGYLGWRGVSRGIVNSGDLTYGFAAVQAWLNGQNPYDADVLAAIVTADGGPIVPIAIGHGVYFPTSLPLFLPIAFVSWSTAALFGLALNVGAALFVAFGLSRWLGWQATSTPALALAAYILALGPVHTTLASGQTGVVATAALVGAMLLEQSRRSVGAGLAYGLAVAVKVQIAAPFLGYLVWRRRWLTAVAAGAILAALTAVSVIRMEIAGIPWLETWTSNLAWLTGPEGNGDPGPGNPERFSLINLAYPLRTLLSEQQASVAVMALVGLAAAATVWLTRDRRPGSELLALSLVSVLALLVTYHRYYDAAVLAIPVAWGFSRLQSPQRLYGLALLIVCSVFLLPSSQVAANEVSASLPGWLTGSWFWHGVVLAHQVWAMVLMAVVLLLAAARDARDP